MHLYQPAKRNQSGFSVIAVLLVILVVAVLAATGFVVYQHHKTTSAKSTADTSQSQTTTKSQDTTSTQPAQATTQYLTIPEQGIRIKLTANTEDAYYSIRNSPVTGQPPFVLLSVHSLDAYPGCGTSQGNDGIAGISTFTKGETDPVVGNFMTAFPNAPQIGGLYYYVDGSQYDCTEGKASTIYSNAKHDFIDAYSTIEKMPN